MTTQFALDLHAVAYAATSVSGETFTIPSAFVRSIIGDCDEETAYNRFATYAFFTSLLFTNGARLFRGALKHERFRAEDENRWRRLLRIMQRKKEYEENLERRLGIVLYELRGSSVRTISETHPPFLPPHWVGQGRPLVERTVEVETRFPDSAYLKTLVQELGYDGHAAIAATVRAHTPWRRPPADRRRAGVPDFDPNDFYTDNQSGYISKEFSYVYQVQPYSPESPSRRTTQGGFPRKRVLEVLRRRRWDSRHVGAVYEVMCQGQPAPEVAERRGLEIGTLYSYCYRVTKELRNSQE